MLKKRNQKGFTLIEIIAVLVILGILAAVAIPKYMDLQNDAKSASAKGFVSAAQSGISMEYARYLLNTSAATGGPAAACANVVVTGPANSNVSCTGANWTVTSSNISANYDGVSAIGTWTRP